MWVCSGGFHDGVTVDIKREVKPRIIASGESLPIRSDRFDFVFLDPPYSEAEAKEMYGTAYPNPFKLLKEAWRVTKDGGHVLFLHRLIPGSMKGLPMRSQNVVAIVGVARVGAWSNMRALTVFRKPEQLPGLTFDADTHT